MPSVTAHARRRLEERWGLTLTDALHAEWCRRCREGDRAVALRACRGPRGLRHLVALFAGLQGVRWVPLLLDEAGGRVVTALPGKALRPYRLLLRAAG